MDSQEKALVEEQVAEQNVEQNVVENIESAEAQRLLKKHRLPKV